MIERVYIDNFKSFSNFEVRLQQLTVILGANGAGKSSLFEAMRKLQLFVSGDVYVDKLFGADTLTRWDKRDRQKFEIDMGINGATYQYMLEVEHETIGKKCRVAREELSYNHQMLYSASIDTESQMKAQLFRDDGSKGPSVNTDWSRSGMSFLQERSDNQLLSRFKDRMQDTWIARLVPSGMGKLAESEVRTPNETVADFASWYRSLSLNRQGEAFELVQLLRDEVLPGFDSFLFEDVSATTKLLKARFRQDFQDSGMRTEVDYTFDELSDGQRSLIVLYAMYKFALHDNNTFCLDQPENHLALPEIQPWLSTVAEAADNGECQVILISHHPELINFLAADSGMWFERDNGGPTRAKPITVDDSSGIPVSELVARGWIHE